MNKPTLENLTIDKPISLAPDKTLIKIYPHLDKFFTFHADTTYLKETLQHPLKDWCDEFLSPTYSLILRFNSGDPYWSLFLNNNSDVNIFMLRFG
jgi:hypothetical protein